MLHHDPAHAPGSTTEIVEYVGRIYLDAPRIKYPNQKETSGHGKRMYMQRVRETCLYPISPIPMDHDMSQADVQECVPDCVSLVLV